MAAPTPTPTPAATNQPPSFTSAGAVNVAENTSAAFYTATASDPNGDALTYSISGGDDRAAFQISSAGALSFASSPDFERPADANGDNVYLLTLSASDGKAAQTLNLAVTVTNTNDGIRVRRIATGYTGIVSIRPAIFNVTTRNPSPNIVPRLFIAQRSGLVSILTPSTGTKEKFFDLGDGRPETFYTDRTGFSANGEGGLLDFDASNPYGPGYWSVSYTDSGGALTVAIGQSDTAYLNMPRLGRFEVELPLRVPFAASATNYGGKLVFSTKQGPRGASGGPNTLFVAVGDGGTAADAQSADSDHGKLFQVTNIQSLGTGSSTTTKLASGLRRPSGLSDTGLSPDAPGLLLTDRGKAFMEELDLFRATPANGNYTFPDQGASYGWPFFEGTTRVADGPQGTPPVLQYSHGTGAREGSAIVGGSLYTGAIAALKNSYVFADEQTGAIWSVPLAEVMQGTTLASSRFSILRPDFTPDQGSIDHPTTIGTDQAGNLYIADADGEIFVVEPA